MSLASLLEDPKKMPEVRCQLRYGFNLAKICEKYTELSRQHGDCCPCCPVVDMRTLTAEVAPGGSEDSLRQFLARPKPFGSFEFSCPSPSPQVKQQVNAEFEQFFDEVRSTNLDSQSCVGSVLSSFSVRSFGPGSPPPPRLSSSILSSQPPKRISTPTSSLSTKRRLVLMSAPVPTSTPNQFLIDTATPAVSEACSAIQISNLPPKRRPFVSDLNVALGASPLAGSTSTTNASALSPFVVLKRLSTRKNTELQHQKLRHCGFEDTESESDISIVKERVVKRMPVIAINTNPVTASDNELRSKSPEVSGKAVQVSDINFAEQTLIQQCTLEKRRRALPLLPRNFDEQPPSKKNCPVSTSDADSILFKRPLSVVSRKLPPQSPQKPGLRNGKFKCSSQQSNYGSHRTMIDLEWPSSESTTALEVTSSLNVASGLTVRQMDSQSVERLLRPEAFPMMKIGNGSGFSLNNSVGRDSNGGMSFPLSFSFRSLYPSLSLLPHPQSPVSLPTTASSPRGSSACDVCRSCDSDANVTRFLGSSKSLNRLGISNSESVLCFLEGETVLELPSKRNKKKLQRQLVPYCSTCARQRFSDWLMDNYKFNQKHE